MATLYISEYDGSPSKRPGVDTPQPNYPCKAFQAVTMGATAVSAALGNYTNYVKLHPDADCFVVCSPTPLVATNSGAAAEFLPSGVDQWRRVPPGYYIGVIAKT